MSVLNALTSDPLTGPYEESDGPELTVAQIRAIARRTVVRVECQE